MVHWTLGVSSGPSEPKMNMRAKTRIMSERLKALAEKYGVALHYQDARGNTVLTKINVVALLSQKMRNKKTREMRFSSHQLW
jgi:hypothetical protein